MELRSMSLIGVLAVACAAALATGIKGTAQRKQEQPSITFGMAKISLGMTVEQVQESLSGAARHIQFLPDKETSVVRRNGDDDSEGQVTFSDGRAIYAQYQMPNALSADELAQEIAGAVDSMEAKSCEASNYSAHGTGGGFSQVIFECGSRRFNVMTVQTLGSSTRTINVKYRNRSASGQVNSRPSKAEIRLHDFSHFVDEPPAVAQGGKGVVVPGCPACKRRINTMSQFLDHLTNDVMPVVIDRLADCGKGR